MSIVSSTYEFTTLKSGAKHVVERHADHLGTQYMRTYFANAGTDLDAKLVEHSAQIEQDLAAAEFEQLLGGE